MITVNINNIKVQVKENTTVLQACNSINIDIPKFCFQENLEIAGNCRMCLVEITNSPKPVASCAMPVMNGMQIYTNTPLVKKARESILEFLLINHPLDCPICDQGGECDLQDQTLQFGSTNSRYHDLKRSVEDKNCGPFIKTIMTRCIHCTRCVRFSNEICGVDNLGTTGRGNHTEISFYVQQIFKSEFSGNVIDLCPVGALTSKVFAFKARPWELKKFETIDVLDSIGSNIIVQTFKNQIIRILPKTNKDLNIEWITDKTRFFFDSIESQRIDYPMIKQDNKFIQITWEKAFLLLKEKITTLDPTQQNVIIGNLIDIKSLYSFKNFVHSLGITNITYKNQPGTSDQSGYKNLSQGFSTPLKDLKKNDLCLFIQCDPRTDGALLNLHLHNSTRKNNLQIFSIGPNLNLTYPVTNLGLTPNILIDILEGKHSFCQKILTATNFSIIIGSKFYNNQNYSSLLRLLEKKFSVNVLNNEVGFLNFCELFHPPRSINNDANLLLLYNTDKEKPNTKVFSIYFGHHFTTDAQNSNIILPCTTFLEKRSYFLNIEHKFQKTVRILKTQYQRKQDITLFNNLRFYVTSTLPLTPFYNYFNHLTNNKHFSTNFFHFSQLKNEIFFQKPLQYIKTPITLLEKYSKNLMSNHSSIKINNFFIK